MNFSKESLKYKKAIEELSQFKFDGTVYLIENPFFLFEFFKNSVVNVANGAGYYEFKTVSLRKLNKQNDLQFILDEAEKIGVIIFHIPLERLEITQNEDKIETYLKPIDPETQSICDKLFIVRCSIPSYGIFKA